MPQMPKIYPLGDGAVTVVFGNTIAEELNQRSISLAKHLTDDPHPGFIEAVPAYSSVTIFYDPIETRRAHRDHLSGFAAVSDYVVTALTSVLEQAANDGRVVEIAVDFRSGSALDLDHVASNARLSPEAVIDLFMSSTYRVYMLGFLPGFAYMGEVDERIATPRRESPRLKVPKGSVGIAGRQTGIYPLESPGGWQIIGRTHMELFTPEGESPCLLSPGDRVRFVSI